jgi:hypothetical protein
VFRDFLDDVHVLREPMKIGEIIWIDDWVRIGVRDGTASRFIEVSRNILVPSTKHAEPFNRQVIAKIWQGRTDSLDK